MWSLVLITWCSLCSGCGEDDSSTPSVVGEDVSSSGMTLDPTCTDDPVSGAIAGASCGCGGQWTCSEGRYLCLGEAPRNGCGGCAALTAEPESACGECGRGVWRCSGEDQVTCADESPRNICGGCAEILGSIDAPCGICGKLTCTGTEELTCLERQPNACGGCEPLEGRLGAPCGECGLWTCDDRGAARCEERDPGICLVTRMIVMGDTGSANAAQYQVAAGAQVRCDRAGGCDGFVMLGDNIYDTGAESAADQQLTEKIDLPYANLKLGPPPPEGAPDERPRMPIYVSLGNHDLGGAGLNSDQVQHYLDYARVHDWFYYPDEFWELKVGQVHLISIHTNPLAYSFPDGLDVPQGQLVDSVVNESLAPWKMLFGHHPYRSDGRHGNAGAYEGLEIDMEVFGFDVSGHGFRQWIDEYVCNRVDFYVSGHDHNRQWINSVPLTPSMPAGAGVEPCNTHFAVSGAGSKTTDLVGRGNDVAFADDTEEGFLFMEFHLDRVEVEFCDADGNTDWSRTIRR